MGKLRRRDSAFVDQMIKDIESKFCIDQNLRFSTGFSFGASMSYAITCAREKQFRAVAIHLGSKIVRMRWRKGSDCVLPSTWVE